MHISLPFLIGALLVLSGGISANAQMNIQDTFTANLSLGSSGTQVTALQQILNREPDTRVAESGPGSPGNETSYFGSLTKRAAIRFQEKYADDILTPVGFARGNGFVGFYTRAKLNTLSKSTMGARSTNIPAIQSPPAAVSPVSFATTSMSSGQATASQNPNLKNLDKVLAAIDTVATKQGYSADTITIIKEQVTARLATTTDLNASFLKETRNRPVAAAHTDSLIGKVLAVIELTVARIFLPERAHAQIATVPFGGALLAAVPCNGGIWNITLTPLPPLFPVLLAYETGSQAFLSYNIPATSWLLGDYEPVPMAYCWIGIYPYPSEGIITPMVGSSPL